VGDYSRNSKPGTKPSPFLEQAPDVFAVFQLILWFSGYYCIGWQPTIFPAELQKSVKII
jgi:hypothetical protein